MRRLTLLAAAALAGLTFAAPEASAQRLVEGRDYREVQLGRGGPLRLQVRPRSWLDAGNTVAPYSSVNPASPQGQLASYLLNPPWQNMRDRFGEGVLPDPITNGPFIGATNPIGPVDYNGILLGLDD